MKRARDLLLLVALVLSGLVVLGIGRIAGTGAIFVDNATVDGNTFTTAASFGGCDGIACDDFESGGWSGGEGWLWGWWYEGDSAVTTFGTPYEGAYHLRLRSYSGYVDRALDLSGQSDVHLQFWAKVDSFEAGDFIDLLVGPSGSMTVAKTWTNADSDNIYHFVDIDLSSYTMSSEFYIAFDAEMSGTDDYFYVDDLVIKVVPGAPTPTPTPPPSCTAGDTDWLNPEAEAAGWGGDNNGFEQNPTNAFADGGGYAQNNNGAGDRHRFYNYGISIPSSCSITGIEVRLDWWLDSTWGWNSMSVQLSWNGGTSWTAAKTDTQETTSEHTVILGGSADTWGHTWTVSELSDANFRVRVISDSNEWSRDFFLDWVPVKVYYGP